MSDHTPTIDGLCGVYASGADDPLLAADEFDRAIAAHDAELRAEIAAEIRAAGAEHWQRWTRPGAAEPGHFDYGMHDAYRRAATIAEGKS